MERTTGPIAAKTSTFILKASVGSLLAAGLLSSASVWAQQAQAAADAAGPVVTVTGVRKAAQSAQTIKRNADEVIDSIVAEEAGKFPDKNVAEVLGRVSGVQLRRESGEASSVIVRGLPGLVTLLNGREIYTARDRNLFLADIPTTMLQRVDVYKTQSADMVEGGTAGVIDVRTSRPFDFKGFTANLAGRVENRNRAKTNDPQVSGMVSNRWKTDFGDVGALLGLSYQKGNYHDEVTWSAPPAHLVPGDPDATGPIDLGHVNALGKRVRLSANWAVQWRPSRTVELYSEGWSTRIDHDMERQFFLGGVGWNPNSTYTFFPGTKQVATVSSTNPAGLFALSSNQAPQDDSESHQGAIGARWDVTPDLRVTTEFSRVSSRWKQEMPILDLTASPTKIEGSTYVNGGAYFNYPGYDMTNPANYRMGALIDNWQAAGGQSNDWRADAIYNNGDESFFREFSGGVRLAQRKASYQHESNNFLPAPAGLPSPAAIPGLLCPSMQLANDYGMNQWQVACAGYLHGNLAQLRKMYGRDGRTAPDPYSLFRNGEDTTAFYGKTRFGFDALGVQFDGTAGVRVVRTDLNVNGFSNINGNPVAVNRDVSSTDVLPNMTLKATLRKDLIARLTAGKAVQRPAFGDFNPGVSLGTTPDGEGIYGGNGGNPDLKPITGKNVDAALEWYFAPTGSVTATVFKHKFEDYVIRRLSLEQIDGKTYRMDRPRNVNDGQLEGIELGYRQFYDFLPGWLSGFGLEANYTYMKGHLMEDGKKNPFQGMSKNAYNIVGLYERGPWSARVAYNWRSEFVDTYNYRALGLDLIVKPIKTADASLSYKINDNMGVTLDVENMLDRTYNDYHGIETNPRDVRRYDRTIGLSLRWKM